MIRCLCETCDGVVLWSTVGAYLDHVSDSETRQMVVIDDVDDLPEVVRIDGGPDVFTIGVLASKRRHPSVVHPSSALRWPR